MGIDISGGMIVGEHASEIEVPKEYDGELYEWAEECGMDCMSDHYDADDDGRFYGFKVEDIDVDKIESDWLVKVKQLAARFEELTGTKARLIGTQDVW